MKTNRIIFVLPAITKKIVGGYKMVYTYANYLSENGYAVCIFYDCNRGKNSKNIPGFICVLVRKILCILEPTWYKLNETIQKNRFIISIKNIFVMMILFLQQVYIHL